MQGNTSPTYWQRRDAEERTAYRRRLSRWHSRLRWRKPLEAHQARPLWQLFLESHDGDQAAALGEVVAALLELGALREDEVRW